MRSTWDFRERTSASSLMMVMSETAKPFNRFINTTTMKKTNAMNMMVLMGLEVNGMSLNSSSPTNIARDLVRQDPILSKKGYSSFGVASGWSVWNMM